MTPEVILLGHSFVGYGTLQALLQLPVKIRRVFTYGDYEERIQPPSVCRLAQNNGIGIEPIVERSPDWEYRFRHHEADVLLSANWRHIIPPQIFERFSHSMNFHGSDLYTKKYRGRKPVQKQIAAGCQRYFLTLHRMTFEVDSGEILLQAQAQFAKVPSELEVYQTFERAAYFMTHRWFYSTYGITPHRPSLTATSSQESPKDTDPSGNPRARCSMTLPGNLEDQYLKSELNEESLPDTFTVGSTSVSLSNPT